MYRRAACRRSRRSRWGRAARCIWPRRAQTGGLPTIAVGLITEPAQAEQVLRQGDADLVALARAFLYHPRWGWQAAAELGGTVAAMPAYWRCLPRPAQAIFGNVRIGMR